MDIQTIKNKTTRIFRSQDVVKAAVFGSYAVGKPKSSSDIDFVVEFSGQKSLFDFADLKLQLEKVLNKDVDLLTYRSLHPLLKNIILKEQKIIYEKKS